MKERLSRIWKLFAGFDILDICNEYFMVSFDMYVDRMKVIEDGPCLILDHYLIVQLWSPNFISPTAKIEKTQVWICFLGLNPIYYDNSILLALAFAIGTPIKVDINTKYVKRGRFTRVCIEVDLTKPVMGRVWMKVYWYQVQYVGLHQICGICSCYGYLTIETKIVETPPAHANLSNDQTPPTITVEANTMEKEVSQYEEGHNNGSNDIPINVEETNMGNNISFD